jgi:bifunctional DNA-binding transcriptional regulator/antitoxin component of YhaV-PrlF toxin-antitoxin module
MKDERDDFDQRDDLAVRRYRSKVTGRHAVTLPAELCRRLGIELGDTVEFREHAGVVTMYPVAAPEPIDPIGMLAGYFESTDDINRFIAQERGRWTEEDEAEYQRNRHSEPAVASDK